MIEPMKCVTVVTSSAKKKDMLLSLREGGMMHIMGLVQHSESVDSLDRDILSLTQVMGQIKEAANKKKDYESKMLTSEEFEALHKQLASLIEESAKAEARKTELSRMIFSIEGWGDFDPLDIKDLSSRGYPLYFYTLGKKEYESLREDENVKFVTLKSVNKMTAVAVIGKPLDPSFPAYPFDLPSESLSRMKDEAHELESRQAKITKTLEEANCYLGLYKERIKVLEQDEMFEKVDATAQEYDEKISLLQGFVPEDKIEAFKSLAASEGWAYLIDDPAEEEDPPTLIKSKGFVKIIQPIFKMLGMVPGYREQDISLYFLLYFSVFFAMIIGDAGYGLIFILLAALWQAKTKKCSDMIILIYVLGACTVIWGAITGTWFGSLAIIKNVKFLQLFIIPSMCNFSEELYGISSVISQNAIMKFSFTLGASHISLACILNIINKIKAKSLGFIADIGWLIDVLVLYMLVLFLVIGEQVAMMPIVVGIAVGFVLVCLFNAFEPGMKFSKGITSSLAGIFTTFLDTISCFGNVMSYIRLFAVGMASLAIAQSFNEMASPMLHGFALPAGILIILIGHALNLVMGILSVLVHGVRLNLLEFSGQLGMEWTGYNYDPFRRTVADTKETTSKGVEKNE